MDIFSINGLIMILKIIAQGDGKHVVTYIITGTSNTAIFQTVIFLYIPV